jgi:high-affinity iron transporter
MNGDGRGRDAAKLDPPPIAFTDKERADQRSLFGLYQVISQGLTAPPCRASRRYRKRTAGPWHSMPAISPILDAAASEGERL